MKSNFRSIRRGDEAKTSIANQFPTTFDSAALNVLEPPEAIPVTSYVPSDLNYAEEFVVAPSRRSQSSHPVAGKDVKDSVPKGCL